MTAAMSRRSFNSGSVSQAHRDVTDAKYRDLRRPRKIRFFCNGDRFFKGKRLYVTPHRYLTFNDLLNDLTGKLPGTVHLPYGVRQIYTPVGGRRVKEIEDLQDGQNYVCAGFETFRPIKYGAGEIQPWSIGREYQRQLHLELNQNDPYKGQHRFGFTHRGRPHNHNLGVYQDASPDYRSSGARGHPGAFQPGRSLRNTYPTRNNAGTFGQRAGINSYWGRQRDQETMSVKPKVVTIIRGGNNAKNDVKILLNRRSVQSYEQLVKDISEAFGPKWKNNKVKKLYTLKGRQVQGVSDFFRDDDVFIAAGRNTPNFSDVQDILEDLYPDNPYAQNLLKQWERSQRKQNKRDRFDEESKRDSGLGSDESNRDEGDNQEFLFKGRHPEQSHGKKKENYVFATEEDIMTRIEEERIKAGDRERDKARKRMQKRMEAEKRVLDEERRKRGLVPLKPIHDPFKRMQEERDKERKRRLAEEKRIRDEEAEAIREKERARQRLHEQQAAQQVPQITSPEIVMVVKEEKPRRSKKSSKSRAERPPSADSDNESNTENVLPTEVVMPEVPSDVEEEAADAEPEEDRSRSRKSEPRSIPPASPAKSPEKSRSPTKSPAKSPTKSPVKSTEKEASVRDSAVKSPAKLSPVPDENANIPPGEDTTKPVEETHDEDKENKDISAQPPASPVKSTHSKEPVKEEPKPKKEKKKTDKNVINKTKVERQISNLDHVLSKYEPGKVLGDGNFAVVKQCKLKKTGLEFAMKVIDKSKLKGKEHMIENEIEIMKLCQHPNIVKLIEEFETKDEIYLIMELVKGGDLFDAITQSVKFGEYEASSMINDLSQALYYLHSQHIVHRDMKPENLMVCRNKDGSVTLKLADFGLTMEVKEPIFTVCGTPTYVAPEILSEIGYGLEVDMWALGVISYILLCGFPPFRSPDRNQTELFEFIKAGEYEFLSPYWDNISNGAKDLIAKLLVVDKAKRFKAIDVLTHPWIITRGGALRAPTNMEEYRTNYRKDLEMQGRGNREKFLQTRPK